MYILITESSNFFVLFCFVFISILSVYSSAKFIIKLFAFDSHNPTRIISIFSSQEKIYQPIN